MRVPITIADHDWLKALQDRNLTTHTYNEQAALEVEQQIRDKYYPLLQQLQQSFAKKINKTE